MATTKVVERIPHPKFPRLSLQLRSDSKYYQAVTYLDGKLRQTSTKAADFKAALKLAENWYRRELRASVAFGNQHPIAKLTTDPTIGELFSRYRATLTPQQKTWTDWRWSPIEGFWRTITLGDVGPQQFRDFYAWRRKRTKGIKAHTLHKDVVLIRQILKYAMEAELLDRLPAIPKPGPMKANPRPWLTRQEWDHLMAIADRRVNEAFSNNKLYEQRVDTQEFAQMMVVTMCRVGELLALRFRDCRFEPGKTKNKRDEVLVAEVTGKRGTRTIVAPPEAARIVKSRRARLNSVQTFKDKPNLADEERVFPEHHRDAFRELLKAADLQKDGHGFTRNFKSLRATAISFRLLAAGPKANLLMIARAAGTSVLMIDQFSSISYLGISPSLKSAKEFFSTPLIELRSLLRNFARKSLAKVKLQPVRLQSLRYASRRSASPLNARGRDTRSSYGGITVVVCPGKEELPPMR